MCESGNVVSQGGRVAARAGYDHDWFTFRPTRGRPQVEWPNGATVALNVVLDLGAVEWEYPDRQIAVPPSGGRGVAPFPDFPRMSHREFGHRVGVFRLAEILEDLGIAPALVVDVLTVEHYERLMDRLAPSASEVIAGGLSASRPITSLMSAEEERHYIESTLERLRKRLGFKPAGWLGPQHSESARTPALLADAGLIYVADWVNDDQPYPMVGNLWSYPLSWELSDLSASHLRQVTPAAYAAGLLEGFSVLRKEGGRVLSIHLQPWSAGQAFRAAYVETALKEMRASDDAWWASPVEIVTHYKRHSGGAVGGSRR